MIRSTIAALAALLLSTTAYAQAVVPGCPTPGSIPCVATQVFTPSAETTLAVTAVSGRVAYPATGSLNLMVTNTGTKTAFVKAGSVTTVATTSDIPVDAGLTIVLPQGANTYLAAITGGSDTTSLTLRSGTGQPVIVYGSVTGTVTVVPSGTQDENLTQVGGVTLLRGAGATGTGSQRVTAAQDPTTIAGSAPGTAGTPSTNVMSIQGVASGTVVPVTQTMGSITIVPLDVATITTGGTAVNALTAGHRNKGGWLQNPPSASINLCINEQGTASGTTSAGATTCIPPGQVYSLTPNTGAVSVISSDSAHPFSGMGWN